MVRRSSKLEIVSNAYRCEKYRSTDFVLLSHSFSSAVMMTGVAYILVIVLVGFALFDLGVRSCANQKWQFLKIYLFHFLWN